MNASTASGETAGTIDPAEAEHFGKLAAEWWDPKGSSAMLHRMNPARLRYIRDRIDEHWDFDEHDRRPLEGKSALDVGCGAGLIAEPLARLGAAVTAIDAAPENIDAAKAHAIQSGLEIDYRAGGVEAAADSSEVRYDLITCMEVIEHVTDPAALVKAIAAMLAPGGLLILSTPNRTTASRITMITIGEGLNLIPKGTHDWNKFLTPEELTGLLEAEALEVHDISGLVFSSVAGFKLGTYTSLNYFVTASARETGRVS